MLTCMSLKKSRFVFSCFFCLPSCLHTCSRNGYSSIMSYRKVVLMSLITQRLVQSCHKVVPMSLVTQRLVQSLVSQIGPFPLSWGLKYIFCWTYRSALNTQRRRHRLSCGSLKNVYIRPWPYIYSHIQNSKRIKCINCTEYIYIKYIISLKRGENTEENNNNSLGTTKSGVLRHLNIFFLNYESSFFVLLTIHITWQAYDLGYYVMFVMNMLIINHLDH